MTSFRDETDYGAEVEADFAKFERGEAGGYSFKFGPPSMNHIEARILDRVARMNPEVFAALDDFAAKYADFVDPVIRRFDEKFNSMCPLSPICAAWPTGSWRSAIRRFPRFYKGDRGAGRIGFRADLRVPRHPAWRPK